MTLERVTDPAVWPVYRDEVKQQLEIDQPDWDTLIDGYIQSATEVIERMTDRALVTRTSLLYRDYWPGAGLGCALAFPKPNLLAVNSVKYDDADGIEQTLPVSVYEVNTKTTPGYLKLAPGQSWPDLDPNTTVNRVRIEFDHGYGPVMSDTPQPLRQAIMMLVADSMQERQPVGMAGQVELPFGVQQKIAPFRYRTL